MKKVKVFISYAKNDWAIVSSYIVKIEKLMSTITHKKVKYPIEFWWDAGIHPGADWQKEIHERLKSADVVIFMVSQSFLESAFIQTVEVPIALERQELSGIKLMNVLVENCAFHHTKIGTLEISPKKSGRLKPLAEWSNKAECWEFLRAALKTCLVNSIENLPSALGFNPSMSGKDKTSHVKQFASPELVKLHKKLKPKKKKKAPKERSLIGKVLSFLNDKIK